MLGVLAFTVTIVKRSENIPGFAALPCRWVGERTFGWLLRRRLIRDYERRPDHHEAMVLWAIVTIMTCRLARTTSGTPPIPEEDNPAVSTSDQQAA